MKRIHLYSALMAAALAFSGQAWAAESPTPAAPEHKAGATEAGKLDRHDQEFLRKAADINLVEIELGKVAEKNSTDPKIKKYAANLVKDHTEANQKLARLAASKGYALPDKISATDRHELSSLEKQQGEQFNKDFIAFNIKGHEKAIDLFQKAASKAQDQDVKSYAEKMIPHLKEHLAMARSNHPEAVGEKGKIIPQRQQQLQQQPQPLKQNQQQQQKSPYLNEPRGY